MNGVAATEIRPGVPARDNAPIAASSTSRVRSAAADFWLDLMFRLVGHAPRLIRAQRGWVSRNTYRVSSHIRSAAKANARAIYGPDATPMRTRDYGRGVIASFYDFVCDIGQSLHLSREQLLARIESIDGREHYDAARALRKGAIIATAHMGSFESGAAAVVDREAAGTVHVVFKRDDTRFEQVRSALRQKLGVAEAPVDEGWTLWLRLRDALARDEVVMVQADRVMPGQKGQRVPFLHGHLVLPTGPLKLAMASGAPILPIFAIRTASSRVRIHIEPAIIMGDDEIGPAILRLAAVIEKYVRRYPKQWLLFHKAFCEDADA